MLLVQMWLRLRLKVETNAAWVNMSEVLICFFGAVNTTDQVRDPEPFFFISQRKLLATYNGGV